MADAKITTDHDEIRKWAEARGGRPAVVRSTQGKSGGILRLEFPEAPHHDDAALEEISWDEFFEKFDEADLALLYQDKTARGQKSNFNKLVGRETGDEEVAVTLLVAQEKILHPRTIDAAPVLRRFFAGEDRRMLVQGEIDTDLTKANGS